ncbi:MAG: 2-oxoacid:acceptor oxidoreductase subunit alpha [Candidatus Bathyarchaeota archaeon]|nr:2-oxoacid:acceptor oxidoreductase subunit alpha [Candidatus Bathyarchaeota archaeon]
MLDEVSLLVGGKAGEGVRSTGYIIGRILNRHGLNVFIRDDYQSLIQGGHNFSQIRASSKETWSHYERVDLIAALDQKTMDLHEKELVSNGRVLFDSEEVTYSGSGKALSIPLLKMVEEIKGLKIMRNSALIGVVAYLYGLDLTKVNAVLTKIYREKAPKNLALAKKGYEYAEKNFGRIGEIKRVDRLPKPLLTGNQAIALGAVKAGLKVYIAYPMTPSTSILHYLAGHQDELGLTVVQPENEIAVIIMALGASYAGARSMVASSGGGFALMQEAISMSGMTEVPVVIVECQRGGPSTGVATYTSQADLKFVVNAGHGDFPKVVVAPGDTEEAFYKTAEALNLAWKYQIPVIVLSDKHLSESYKTTSIDESNVSKEGVKMANGGSGYKRYELTEDGISPLAFPGTPEAVIKVNSYEHDPNGYAIDEPELINKMQEKRLRKYAQIVADLRSRETVKIYGEKDADNLVVSWGSAKGAVLEAMKFLKGKFKFLHVIYLKPFPVWEVEKHLDKAKNVISVECNSTGQFASLLREETGFLVNKKILKYDSRPFDPQDLANRIERVLE